MILKRFLFCAVFFYAFSAHAQDDERLRIAVFDPSSSGTSIDEGTKIAVREIISSTIVNTGLYNLVERSLLEKVMQEQQFTNSGAVDDLQATEVGKLAGANKIVLSVVTLTGGRNMLSIKMIDVKTASVERQRVDVVKSGEILDAVEPLTLGMLDIAVSSPSVATRQPSRGVKQGLTQMFQKRPDNTENAAPAPKAEKPSILASLDIPDGYLFFYGVDFSSVKLFGTDESSEKFKSAFTGINELMVLERKKYSFDDLTGQPVSYYPIPAEQANESIVWETIRTGNPAPKKRPLHEIINAYRLPHNYGTGIVLIAWLLNKDSGKATYELVFFDIPTRQILFNTEVTGNAGGAGLRNYWAGSIHEVLKDKKLKKNIAKSL